MPNLNTLLDDHILLKYECVDRIFLNGYVAKLQEPSVALEAAIEELLAEGLGDGERLAEIGRLGARLVLQRAVEDEATAFLGRARYERTPRRAARGTETGRVGCRPPRASWRSKCRRSEARQSGS